MKLHAQCDRCKAYAETVDQGFGMSPRPPAGWVHLCMFQEPLRLNQAWHMPEGSLNALLCPTCAPIVQKAAEAAIARRT